MSDLTTYSRTIRTGIQPLPRNPFHAGLADLRSGLLTRTGSQDWLDRFGESLHHYFDGCIMEYYGRHATRDVGLAEYRRLRAWSIGTLPVFDLIELSSGQMTQTEAYDPWLERLKERASLLCAWANDIYSYKKESDAGDPMNLVAVLAKEYKLPLGEAYGAAAEVFNTDWDLFQEERDEKLADCSDTVAAYVSGLEDWIFGNLEWTGLCHRYRLEARAVS